MGIAGKYGIKARLRLNRTITKSYNSKYRTQQSLGSNKISCPTHTPYCLKQPISLSWAGSVRLYLICILALGHLQQPEIFVEILDSISLLTYSLFQGFLGNLTIVHITYSLQHLWNFGATPHDFMTPTLFMDLNQYYIDAAIRMLLPCSAIGS